MDRQIQRQSKSVGDEVALAATDLLAGVIAAQTAGFRGFHTLAVDHAGRRRRLLAVLLACVHQQDYPDLVPT
jgi:hypothetical protein